MSEQVVLPLMRRLSGRREALSATGGHMIDPDGRPSVKLAGSAQGAGLSLLGDAEPTYIVLNAHGAESSLKLISDGRQQLVKP